MPPKKEEKKGKKGEAVKLELDPELYIRQPDALEAVVDPTPDSKEVLQGKIANIDLLFPEWDAAAIAAENWAEPLQADQQPQIQYPSELEVKDTTTIAKYYGLDTEQPVDPKAKGKKDNKKKEPETEAVEKIATEAGLPLPVVFKNSMHPTILTENPAETVIDKSVDEEFKDYKLLRPFCQYPSPEQLQVIEYQEKIKRRIARAQQAVKGTDEKPVTDPSPEAIKKLDELENLLEKTVKENSCRVNNGAEVDSFVCSAYKIIHKYAPLIFSTTEYAQLAADGRSMDYLWNSIYPKLASGKPYFNVAGKYCVKLYLGGKWRKIYVDDKIPLKADGMVAVASSSDKLELWPLIIAKAVYTVYSACGYSTLLSAGEGDTKVLHSAQFVAFVVHLLTGWRPNTPLLCQAMREHEPEQIRKAIRAMIEGGAGDIKSNLIVDDNSNNVILDLEKYIQTETSARNRKNPDGTAIRKTVAEFKEDYNKRKAGRDEVVTRILKRETQIQEIHKLVDVAFNEVFLLVVPSSTDVGETVSLNGTTDNLSDSLSVIDNQIIEEISSSMNSLQNHAVYSISGVSFPEGYEEFGDSYLQIRILTDWYSSSADESETSRVDTINVPPTGQDSMEPKIVAPTKLRYNWITVQELIDSNAGIVSLETAFLNANSADCPRHWVTPSPLSVDPKAKKDKIKDSKVVPAEEDGVLSYPGLFPATLLSINCSGLRKSSIKSEEDEAIEAQQQALTEIQTGEDKPDRSSHEHKPYFPEFITLVVCIHADSVLPQKMSSDDSNNDSSVFTKHGIITDDIELVLQQFDINGDLKPMTFKIDLPSNGMMPITRQTIKIPSAAINNPNSDEMFFWLRLLTKASLHISFHSNAIVTVGKAETIWTGMSDRKALVKEGDALPTRPTSEHLIFRLPLEFVDKDIEGCCAVFLHIEDVQVENCVSILVSGSSAYSLPNTQNALVKLNKGSSSALLGRVFPSQVKNTVASFHWKLIILSYHSLVDPPLPIASQPVTQRFSGKYYPNKKIQLFRDVYKVEKSSFPISLRLRLTVSSQEEQEKSQSKQLNIPESTCLVFKIFRKFESETKLVHEYRGRGTISCYDVAILDFLNNGEDPGSKSAVPTDPKATKGKVQTAESIDLIFQCCVDETAMQVPSDWRSKFPFYYDRLKQSSEEENTASPKALALEAPKISPFGWCLDILEGKTVQVSHDTVQLLKHLEVKNSWESESAGRSSKAASALEYYRLRRQMESTAGENKQDAEDIKTKMLETLNQCLEGVEAADQLKSRYSYLYTLSKYEEHIELASEGMNPTLVDQSTEKLEEIRVKREVMMKTSEELYTAIASNFTVFNSKVVDATRNRIDHLIAETVANQKELGAMWEGREKYRLEADKKNASLQFVLGLASEAKQAAYNIENGIEDKGKGKKGAKKK